jgi:hypothetical protein
MPPADPVNRHLRCRLHDFPDPDFSGGNVSFRIHGSPGSDLTRNSPVFQGAWQACQGGLPGKVGGGVTQAGTK